jgi:hypothetical protein
MNTECIISSFIEDVSGFPNRQAELDLQAFPNRVWERGSCSRSHRSVPRIYSSTRHLLQYAKCSKKSCF